MKEITNQVRTFKTNISLKEKVVYVKDVYDVGVTFSFDITTGDVWINAFGREFHHRWSCPPKPLPEFLYDLLTSKYQSEYLYSKLKDCSLETFNIYEGEETFNRVYNYIQKNNLEDIESLTGFEKEKLEESLLEFKDFHRYEDAYDQLDRIGDTIGELFLNSEELIITSSKRDELAWKLVTEVGPELGKQLGKILESEREAVL